MKAMVCEMCGSNDIVEVDGLYVCQHCGTKYDADVAQRLTIELTGSVSVDGIASADSLLDRAQEFYDTSDWEKSLEYVNKALDVDAQNTRARKLQRALSDHFLDKARESFENYNWDEAIGYLNRATEIDPQNEKAHQLQGSLGNKQLGDVDITYKQYCEIVALLRNGNKIEAIKQIRLLTHWGLKDAKDFVEGTLMPELGIGGSPKQGGKPKSGGCYVATAVYGSYDCPEVWTLRRFRDYRLAQTRRGRLFVKLYYATSPTIVRIFGNTTVFSRILKAPLDMMVRKCRESGLTDTPYEDMEW